MHELTIITPYSKQEVSELAGNISAELAIEKKQCKKKSHIAIGVFLFAATSLIVSLFFESESDVHISLLPVGLFWVAIISAICCLFFRHEFNNVSNVDDVLFYGETSSFMADAIKKKDKPMALFINEVNKQGRKLTKNEANFLSDYFYDSKRKKEELELQKQFDDLLSR